MINHQLNKKRNGFLATALRKLLANRSRFWSQRIAIKKSWELSNGFAKESVFFVTRQFTYQGRHRAKRFAGSLLAIKMNGNVIVCIKNCA